MHKIRVVILLVVMLAGVGRVEGTIVEFDEERAIQGADGGKKALVYTDGWAPGVGWTSGHHVIVDGDQYGEIWMYNDARATMFGGEAFKLETFDVSAVDILDGQVRILYVHDESIAELYGCSLESLGISENALVNLYAYNVTFYERGGYYGRGRVEGRYLASDSYFAFDLIAEDSFSHINVIPEPATVFLVGLGGLAVRRRDLSGSK